MRRRLEAHQIPVKPAPNAGLTLFVAAGRAESRWLRLVLAEKDVESATVEVVDPERPSDDFVILNPSGVLPALADREGVVIGPSVIAEYLDERYPHPALMPLGPGPRARVRMCLRHFETHLLDVVEALTRGKKPSSACAQALRDAAQRFDGRVGGGIVVGTDYTLGDTAWAVFLWALAEAAAPLPQRSTGLRRYADRLLQRAAVVKVMGS